MQARSFTYSAVCQPERYSCDPQTRLFFFDASFLKENKIPQGAPCSFFFFYNTKSLCFSGKIYFQESGKGRRLCCHAARLFYVDGESFFSNSVRGNILLNGVALAGSLSVRMHKSFQLDTADIRGRTAQFLQFATSNEGFSDSLEDYAVSGGNGILFYLDHRTALTCFPASSASLFFSLGKREYQRKNSKIIRLQEEPTLTPIERIIALKESAQQGRFRVDFGPRKIRAECSAVLRIFRSALIFCNIAFTSLEPENIRFLYEMSKKEKYLGGEFF